MNGNLQTDKVTTTDGGSLPVKTVRIRKGCADSVEDLLTREEPLQICLGFGPEGERQEITVAITMCTPGMARELALGFVWCEGIIENSSQVRTFELRDQAHGMRVHIELNPEVVPQLRSAERFGTTHAGCGICGRVSLESLLVSPHRPPQRHQLRLSVNVLRSLPERMRAEQRQFLATGGMHAAALFDLQGNLLALCEDVGRHNALDKLIGAAAMAGQLPMEQRILAVSGRASFELLQKAAMAGAPVFASISAPSSAALALAKRFDMVLVGFLRSDRMNIYHGVEAIEGVEKSEHIGPS